METLFLAGLTTSLVEECLYIAAPAIIPACYILLWPDAGCSPTGHCLQVVNGPGSVPVLVLCVRVMLLSLDPLAGATMVLNCTSL